METQSIVVFLDQNVMVLSISLVCCQNLEHTVSKIQVLKFDNMPKHSKDVDEILLFEYLSLVFGLFGIWMAHKLWSVAPLVIGCIANNYFHFIFCSTPESFLLHCGFIATVRMKYLSAFFYGHGIQQQVHGN